MLSPVKKNSCIFFLGKMSIGGKVGGPQLDHLQSLGLDLPNEAGMFRQLRVDSSLQRASTSEAQQDPMAGIVTTRASKQKFPAGCQDPEHLEANHVHI